MRLRPTTTFYCFSPPVMLATFLIETFLLLWVIVRYGLSTPKKRLIAAMLVFLAIFQLAEYNVCGRFNINGLGWSRIGFVAITCLPPLGLHLAHVLAGRKNVRLTRAAYMSGLFFIYLFAFSSFAFNSHVCAGNYAIFQLRNHIGAYFFVYYYFWLLLTMYLSLAFMRGASRSVRKVLFYLVSGYGFFLIPTTVVNMVKPETIYGIPSVMCGFAVIYALVIVFGILPEKETKPVGRLTNKT